MGDTDESMPVQQTDTAVSRSSCDGLVYQRAVAFVEENVRIGKYYPGQKLPSIRVLSKQLAMNFQTLRRAINPGVACDVQFEAGGQGQHEDRRQVGGTTNYSKRLI